MVLGVCHCCPESARLGTSTIEDGAGSVCWPLSVESVVILSGGEDFGAGVYPASSNRPGSLRESTTMFGAESRYFGETLHSADRSQCTFGLHHTGLQATTLDRFELRTVFSPTVHNGVGRQGDS